MAAHEDLKKKLRENQGKAFVKDLTQSIYDWADKVPVEYYNYRIFEELTVRYQTGEKTRLGLQKNEHYRFDAVLFVQPGWRALNQRQCYTVGIELKGELGDLRKDSKFCNYLGWTDYFFFGVTSDLVDDALKKISGYKEIGLVDVEQGLLIRLPKKCTVSQENQIWLYEQVIYNTVFSDIKSVYFELQDVEVTHPAFGEVAVKILPEYINVSNNDTLKEGENNASKDDTNKPVGLSDEEKAARKAAAEARQEYRRKKAHELAKQGFALPESIRVVLSALPDKVQETYYAIRTNPGINAHGLEGEIGVAEATAKRFVAELVGAGLAERQGSKKTGGYYVTESRESDLKYMPKCADCVLLKAVKEQHRMLHELKKDY